MDLLPEAVSTVSKVYTSFSFTTTVVHTLFSQRDHAQSAIIRWKVIFSPHHSVNTHSNIRPICTLNVDFSTNFRGIERVSPANPFSGYARDLPDLKPRTEFSTKDVTEFQYPREVPRASGGSRPEDDEVV